MTLDKKDWKQLDKRFKKIDQRFEKVDKRFEKQHKEIISDVKKLLSEQDERTRKQLVAQDIRNFGKMQELEEKFEKHTTKLKSDFLEKIDPVLKEVTASREERKLVAKTQSEHTDQIEKINKHLGQPTQN